MSLHWVSANHTALAPSEISPADWLVVACWEVSSAPNRGEPQRCIISIVPSPCCRICNRHACGGCWQVGGCKCCHVPVAIVYCADQSGVPLPDPGHNAGYRVQSIWAVGGRTVAAHSTSCAADVEKNSVVCSCVWPVKYFTKYFTLNLSASEYTFGWWMCVSMYYAARWKTDMVTCHVWSVECYCFTNFQSHVDAVATFHQSKSPVHIHGMWRCPQLWSCCCQGHPCKMLMRMRMRNASQLWLEMR